MVNIKYIILAMMIVVLSSCSVQNNPNPSAKTESTINTENLTLFLENEKYLVYEINKTDEIRKYIKETFQIEGNYDGKIYVHDLNRNNMEELYQEGQFYFTSTKVLAYDPIKDEVEVKFEVDPTTRILHLCVVNDRLIYYSKVLYDNMLECEGLIIPYTQIIEWKDGKETIIDEFHVANSTDGGEFIKVKDKVYYSKIAVDNEEKQIESSIMEVGNNKPIWINEIDINNYLREEEFQFPLNHASFSKNYGAFVYSSDKESHILYFDGSDVKDVKVDGYISHIAVVDNQVIFFGGSMGALNCDDGTISKLNHHAHLNRVSIGENGVFIGCSNSEAYITIQKLEKNELTVDLIYEMPSNNTYSFEHIANNEFLVHFEEHQKDENGRNVIKHKLYLIKVLF